MDLLLVSNLVNVRYLWGFGGTNGMCLVGKASESVFLTDFRYVERERTEVPGLRTGERASATCSVMSPTLARPAPRERAVRLGFDDASLTVEALRGAGEPARATRSSSSPRRGSSKALRARKDEREIAAIRAATRRSRTRRTGG